MNAASPIPEILERVRQRLLFQALVDRLSLAAACGLFGFLLLLLAGTQVLHWWWPLLLLGGALAWGIVRALRGLPGLYRVAQQLDLRCGLKDLVSTAFHFGSHRADARNAAVIDQVRQGAESAAETVDVRAAFPLRATRWSWAALGMLVVVLGAFGVRYGVLRTFDLSQPLLAVNIDPITGAPVSSDDGRKMAKKLSAPELEGFTLPDADRAAIEENERAIEEQLKSFDVLDPDQAGPHGAGQKSRAASNSQQEEGEQSAGEKSSEGDNPTLSSGGDDSKQGGQPKQPPKQPEKNSLLDKMRDAMANLMDKFKMDSKNSEQEADSKSGQSKGEGQQQAQGQKGQQQQGKPQSPGDPNDPQQGNQPGDAADAQNAQMTKGSQMQEPPSNNPKSGVGKSDGNKDVEAAQQLEAMGKLSELLSKRAEKIQGEMMVEVTNTRNQQARTPYSGKTAAHADSGGELTRDEVPLHLQHYVQKYYEQVRKPQPSPPSGAKQ